MPNENKILLNFDEDCETFFINSLHGDYEDLAQKACAYLEKHYKDNVGDILFNVFCQSSLTPSRVFTTKVEKYYQTVENGIPVDYSDNKYLRSGKISQEDHGVCITGVWIEHCKKIGITPWLSFRMNDHHCWQDETSSLRSDFYYEAKKNGWLLGEKYRSSQNDFDYGVPEVREKMLAYIKEQLTAFDVYGIELDFMREPKCVKFYDDPHACDHINEFLVRTKEIVEECTALHGHPVKIAVRLPRDMALCKTLGFDVTHWAKEGLIDVVIPSSHWPGVDTGMPIATWHKALSPYGVEVYACMEMNLPNSLYVDLEVAKAHTAQYQPQGSARTYVFNLYHPHLDYVNALGIWAIPAPTAEELAELWSTCGDIEKCLRGTRRHILTEESPAFDYLHPQWKPLPALVGDGTDFEVQTGVISQDAALTLFLGVTPESAEALTVLVNGVACKKCTDNARAHVLKNPEIDPNSIRAFRVPASACNDITQNIHITAAQQTEIFYLELMVDEK